MLTVSITVNGKVVFARTAVHFGDDRNGVAQYRTDCNKVIEHKPKDGIIPLAKKMLDCIKEE